MHHLSSTQPNMMIPSRQQNILPKRLFGQLLRLIVTTMIVFIVRIDDKVVQAFAVLSTRPLSLLLSSSSPPSSKGQSTQTKNKVPHHYSLSMATTTTTNSNDNNNLDDDDDDDDDDSKVIEIESLTYNQLLELIEISFLQACLALMKGETDAVQLFIVGVKAASMQQPSAIQLIQDVNSSPSSSNIGGRRPLDEQEQNLRGIWIQAIYLMIAHLDEKESFFTSIDISQIDKSVSDIYSPTILNDIVAIHQSGLGLNVPNFITTRRNILFPEQNNNPLLLLEEEEEQQQRQLDVIEVAIVSQTIKLLYYALLVLEDDEEDEKGSSSLSEAESQAFNYAKKRTENGTEEEEMLTAIESLIDDANKASKKKTKKKKKKSQNQKKASSGGRGFG